MGTAAAAAPPNPPADPYRTAPSPVAGFRPRLNSLTMRRSFPCNRLSCLSDAPG